MFISSHPSCHWTQCVHNPVQRETDQILSSWMQHGGDGAYATSEPGLTGRAQGGPAGPHEGIQGTTSWGMKGHTCCLTTQRFSSIMIQIRVVFQDQHSACCLLRCIGILSGALYEGGTFSFLCGFRTCIFDPLALYFRINSWRKCGSSRTVWRPPQPQRRRRRCHRRPAEDQRKIWRTAIHC